MFQTQLLRVNNDLTINPVKVVYVLSTKDYWEIGLDGIEPSIRINVCSVLEASTFLGIPLNVKKG